MGRARLGNLAIRCVWLMLASSAAAFSLVPRHAAGAALRGVGGMASVGVEQDRERREARRQHRAAMGLEAQMGLSRSPYPSPQENQVSGLLTTFRLQAAAALSDQIALELRVALAVAGVDLPAGGVRPNSAWAHPELAAVGGIHDAPSSVLQVRLGLAVPFGTADDASLSRRPFQNQSLVLAAAQAGWRDRELFAPGRMALTPAFLARGQRGLLSAFALLKVPLMLAVKRDTATTEPRVRVSSLAASVALGAGASLSFGRVNAGLASWVVLDLVPAAEVLGRRDSRAALSLVPEVKMRLTEGLVVATNATVFLAGAIHAPPAFGVALAGAY